MMIYVTLVGHNMVAASETQTTATQAALEMVQNQVVDHMSDSKERCDIRSSISIRTVYVELKR